MRVQLALKSVREDIWKCTVKQSQKEQTEKKKIFRVSDINVTSISSSSQHKLLVVWLILTFLYLCIFKGTKRFVD